MPKSALTALQIATAPVEPLPSQIGPRRRERRAGIFSHDRGSPGRATARHFHAAKRKGRESSPAPQQRRIIHFGETRPASRQTTVKRRPLCSEPLARNWRNAGSHGIWGGEASAPGRERCRRSRMDSSGAFHCDRARLAGVPVQGCRWPGVACALDPPIETHGVDPGVWDAAIARAAGAAARRHQLIQRCQPAERCAPPDERGTVSCIHILREFVPAGWYSRPEGLGGSASEPFRSRILSRTSARPRHPRPGHHRWFFRQRLRRSTRQSFDFSANCASSLNASASPSDSITSALLAEDSSAR